MTAGVGVVAKHRLTLVTKKDLGTAWYLGRVFADMFADIAQYLGKERSWDRMVSWASIVIIQNFEI